MRTVLVSQADLSKRAAILAASIDPSLGATFHARADVYRQLAQASRTVGGEAGGAGLAALKSANPARRLRSGPADGEDIGEALRRLAHLSERVDGRVSAAVEHGFQQRLYFVAIKLPCLDTQPRSGVVRPLEKWIAIDSSSQSELLALAREQLRPIAPVVPQFHQASRG